MLKNIPANLSPDLVKTLMEMGHGDEIVLGDANFTAVTLGQRVIRADGLDCPQLLDSILQMMPLDTYAEYPVVLMETDNGSVPPVWPIYREIIKKNGENENKIEKLERFRFYDRAKKAFAVVATGELAIYANIILKKGVIFK